MVCAECRNAGHSANVRLCRHARVPVLGEVLITGQIVTEYCLPSAAHGKGFTDKISFVAVYSGHTVKTLFPVVIVTLS